MSQTPKTTASEASEVKNPVPRIDITGQKFGMLTAKEFVRTSDWNTGWRCICDCGKERIVNGYFLRSGDAPSCGCHINSSNGPEFLKIHEEKGVAHSCYVGMMTRCYNPNVESYKRYGAVGIKVCEAYQDRQFFCQQFSDRPSRRHTLHRLSNSGSYSCGKCEECVANGWTNNVVWADDPTQARERSNNHKITYKGETLCMMDMAEKHGVSYFVLRNRLSRDKWSVEEAIETPVEPPDPLLTHQGKQYSQQGLAKAKGIHLSTLRQRLKAGMSVEEAIETPITPRSQRRSFSKQMRSASAQPRA